jgi:hypothetical protein
MIGTRMVVSSGRRNEVYQTRDVAQQRRWSSAGKLELANECISSADNRLFPPVHCVPSAIEAPSPQTRKTRRKGSGIGRSSIKQPNPVYIATSSRQCRGPVPSARRPPPLPLPTTTVCNENSHPPAAPEIVTQTQDGYDDQWCCCRRGQSGVFGHRAGQGGHVE